MSEIKTKFSIGDKVFHAWTTITKKRRDCPDCLGSRKWKATSPAGGTYEFSCPRCSTNYQSDDGLSLDYSQHAPLVEMLTIGSVRIDTNDETHPISYMCRETGIGSGTIHYESTLFATREEAEREAATLAEVRNLSTPWIVKQFDKTLSLSDYELQSAALKNARDERNSHQVKLEMLFGDLRDCETIEQIKQTLDGFSLREAA